MPRIFDETCSLNWCSRIFEMRMTANTKAWGLGLLLLATVQGQFVQQGSKLVGSGGILEPLQGSSVALSADGNTALVGGYNDGNFIGAVWVFTRSGGTWVQQGGKLTGNVGFFGTSVAL